MTDEKRVRARDIPGLEVDAAARGAVLRKATLWVLVLIALAASLAYGLYRTGHPAEAAGIALAHGVATASAVTWLLGSTLAFGAGFVRFLIATIGLSPLRFAFVVGGAFATWSLGEERASMAAFVLTLAASQFALHLVEAAAFSALSDAGSPPRRPPADLGRGGGAC